MKKYLLFILTAAAAVVALITAGCSSDEPCNPATADSEGYEIVRFTAANRLTSRAGDETFHNGNTITIFALRGGETDLRKCAYEYVYRGSKGYFEPVKDTDVIRKKPGEKLRYYAVHNQYDGRFTHEGMVYTFMNVCRYIDPSYSYQLISSVEPTSANDISFLFVRPYALLNLRVFWSPVDIDTRKTSIIDLDEGMELDMSADTYTSGGDHSGSYYFNYQDIFDDNGRGGYVFRTAIAPMNYLSKEIPVIKVVSTSGELYYFTAPENDYSDVNRIYNWTVDLGNTRPMVSRSGDGSRAYIGQAVNTGPQIPYID